MSDIYAISVKIGMQNGVSSVLQVIQRDLMGLNSAIDLTAGKFSRMQVAVAGGMTAMAGIATLGAFAEIARAGGKLLDQQQVMLSNGTTQVDLAREMATAYSMVGIGGSNLVDNLKMVSDLRQLLGATNLPEALTLAPTLMKAGIATGLSLGIDPEKAAYTIALIQDNLGYDVNPITRQLDPNRVADTAKTFQDIIAGSGGRVTLDMLLAFSKQARTAGRLLSDEGLLKMAPVIQAMGGYRAGTGLQAFDRAGIGGVMTTRGTSWLEKLGLLNPDDVHNGESGYVRIDPGSIKGSDQMASDPQAWANSVLLPALEKAGMTTADAMKVLAPGLDASAGTGTSSLLTQIIQSGLANTTNGLLSELIGNTVQNAKDYANYQQAYGVDQYPIEMSSLSGAWGNFKSSLDSVFDTLGLPAAQMSVVMLNDIAGALRSFDQWLAEHPGYASAIDKVLLGLGVGLTALGTALLVGALGLMVGTGGFLFALAAAIGTVSSVLIVGHWHQLSSDFSTAMLTIEHAIQRTIYDIEHPGQALADLTGAGSASNLPGGGRFQPRTGGPAQTHTIGDDYHATVANIQVALAGIQNWINGGAPTNATVTNPGEIAVATSAATLQRIDHQMSAPQTGPTQGSYRATPSGSAANSAR